jgi:Na+/proline symporter
MILGMQGLGAVFYALSLGHLSFTAAVVLGVVVMAFRQFWTVRMGMRGIVISDLFQGIVAYLVGSAMIIGLIAWLYANGASWPPGKFQLPGPGSDKPLLFLSLSLLPLLSYRPALHGLRRRERQAFVRLHGADRARLHLESQPSRAARFAAAGRGG